MSCQPRVLHVIDRLGTGGMERALVNLVNGLQKSGSPQAICCLRDAGPLASDLEEDVTLFELGAEGRDWRLPKRIRKIVEDGSFDLVHGQNLGTWSDVVRAVGGRLPIVQSFHGFLGGRPSVTRHSFENRLARRTHSIVAVSNALKDVAVERFGVSVDRVSVIENGIDPERFSGTARGLGGPDLPESLRSRFLCVTVASLTEAKSPSTLVRAARSLQDDIAFVWVGAGVLAEDTRRLISQSGIAHRFHLAGEHSDIRPYLQAASLFVLPSRTEAAPMSLLEAMASGLPVVATHVGGIPEMITSGEEGLLVEPLNAARLAEAIRRLAADADIRDRAGRLGQVKVRQRFSTERMTRRYADLYAAIVAHQPATTGAC